MKKHIVFMYPSRNIGGAQLLFSRLACYLAEEDIANVSVVDYHDGFIRRQLESVPAVNFIDYSPGVTLPVGSVTIIALTHLAYLRFMVSRKSLSGDFLLWSLHPKNIEHVLYSYFRHFFQLRRKKILSLLSEMAELGSIVFMDGSNKFSFERAIGSELTVANFLPIPIPIPIQRTSDSSVHTVGSNIAIAWLGRISRDKLSAIEKVIEEISLSKYKNNIIFHVIGDGAEIASVFKYADRKNVQFNHVGILEQPALDDFLVNQVHFGIAMGTSCLEFAKVKIPVAIADYSYSKIPHSHGYDWLYDTANFTLGNDVAWGFTRRMVFDDLILDFTRDKLNEVGLKCYDYSLENHSIHSVSKRLLESLDTRAQKKALKVSHVERLINPCFFSAGYRISLCIKRTLMSLRTLVNLDEN